MRHRKRGPTGYGILRYELPSTEEAYPLRSPPAWPARDDTDWSLKQVRRLRSLRRVKLPKPSRVITMIGTQNRLLEDGRLVWSMNNFWVLGHGDFDAFRTPEDSKGMHRYGLERKKGGSLLSSSQ